MGSFWKLLEPHLGALHALLLRLTLRQEVADEMLHDLILKLHRSSGFTNAREPGAYARRGAINLAMDWRRSDSRRGENELLSKGVVDSTDGPYTLASVTEEIESILAAAEELGTTARAAFVLRYVQQESYEKVGEIIGKTAHQARGICHAAVKKVRERLAERQVNHARVE